MRNEEQLQMLPEHMQEGMKNYIEKGIPPGTFLRLMLEHKIYDAAILADAINQQYIFRYIHFMYNFIPADSHGDKETVDAWIKQGGYNGTQE